MCGLCIVTSFQRTRYGRGEGDSHFTVEKPDKHHLTQVTKVNINLSHVDNTYPCYDTMTMALYLCDLPPNNS